MAAKQPTTNNGSENVRWNTDWYTSPDDPQIDKDTQELADRMAAFEKNFKGQLTSKLGAALTEMQAITNLGNKLGAYFFLKITTDNGNEKLKQRQSRMSEAMSKASAHMVFFSIEVGAMDESDYQALLANDAVVAHHKPMLDHTRRLHRYTLSEEVERALAIRSPFGPGEWSDYFDETEAEIMFSFQGREVNLPELLHIASSNADAETRAEAMETLNKGFKEHKLDKIMARALNATMGAKMVNDGERGYATPMSSRNLSNQVDDETVEALHEAVKDRGAALNRRFYQLKAKLLGKNKLKWSDRNAPMPFADTAEIPWQDAVDTVIAAYEAFSPTLAAEARRVFAESWVDGPTHEGKSGGAFNLTSTYPDGERSHVMMNYLGTNRDVATLAHELGHAVHGLLGVKAQGPLMWHAPMAYAETASIFGEMLTFRSLLDSTTDKKVRLAMLMDKINDFMNSVVRQISFSEFERRAHAKRREGKLTVEDFNQIWMDVTREFYGNDGDVFEYGDIESMWCYVSHFLRPFYVYAYAFGELFTHSLFAVKDNFGPQFEGMYLDLLRAGGTKGAVDLMSPFGLDPADPQFWKKGHDLVAGWLDEAEKLAADLKLDKAA